MDDVMRGRVWRFGDDISTDLLSPGAYAVDPVEVRKLHVLESVDPNFAGSVEPGDLLVVGRNFGCGSSRETAPENLAALGIACVVAASFARIFLRNAVAIGLPVLICPDAQGIVETGQQGQVDLAAGVFENLTTGATAVGEPLPEEMRRILAAGGILAGLTVDDPSPPSV